MSEVGFVVLCPASTRNADGREELTYMQLWTIKALAVVEMEKSQWMQ